MTDTEILSEFYKKISLSFDGKFWIGKTADFIELGNYRLNYDLLDAKSKKPIAEKRRAYDRKKMGKIGRIRQRIRNSERRHNW